MAEIRFRTFFVATTLAASVALLASGCSSGGGCKGAGCHNEVTSPFEGDAEDAADADDVAGEDIAPEVETVTGSVCSTGETNGCADNYRVIACAPDGESWTEVECFDESGDGICLDGRCTACTPFNRKCVDDETVAECAEDGSGYVSVETCNGAATGRVCTGGLCTRLCEIAIKFQDYMGCEYWAADLDNAFVRCGGSSGYCDAQSAPYAIVVSNPHPSWSADVKIWRYDPDAGTVVQVTQDRDGLPFPSTPVQPGELRIFYMPTDKDLPEGQSMNIEGTSQKAQAYRIESSIPITAYQFNPLENVEVYSNDASLLLPTNVLGRYYFVMSREQSFEALRSYVSIVASNPGLTNVSIQVTAHTLPNDQQGIPPLSPGETINRVLSQYEVLNIETNRIGDDMTGTLVLTDRPVAVFGGSEASNAPNTNHCVDNEDYDPTVPDSSPKVCEWDGTTACEETADCSSFITCCADHLEQQLFPVKTWGRRYLATRSFARGGESDNWRIIAAEDGTVVTTLPPLVGIRIPPLDKGEWFDFETQQDFEIVATKPVMVGQFLQAEQAPGPGKQPDTDAGTGDPAFILAVPLEQFRPDYVFLAPNKYQEDYVNIIAPAEATVELDGLALSEAQFDVFGTGDYKVARLPIDDGVHTLLATEPVSVIVYGYDQYVSYGYPAGLNLTELNEEPGLL